MISVQTLALVWRRILALGNLFRNCKVKVELVTDQNFVELKWKWKVDLKNNLTWQHFFCRWKFVCYVCITWNISNSRPPPARYHVRYSWKVNQAVFGFIKHIKLYFTGGRWISNSRILSWYLRIARWNWKSHIASKLLVVDYPNITSWIR